MRIRVDRIFTKKILNYFVSPVRKNERSQSSGCVLHPELPADLPGGTFVGAGCSTRQAGSGSSSSSSSTRRMSATINRQAKSAAGPTGITSSVSTVTSTPSPSLRDASLRASLSGLPIVESPVRRFLDENACPHFIYSAALSLCQFERDYGVACHHQRTAPGDDTFDCAHV